MYLETQFKIKSNPKYHEFLRHNSYWYKQLNRKSENFYLFENDVKDKMHLRLTDKVGQMSEVIDMMTMLFSNFK